MYSQKKYLKIQIYIFFIQVYFFTGSNHIFSVSDLFFFSPLFFFQVSGLKNFQVDFFTDSNHIFSVSDLFFFFRLFFFQVSGLKNFQVFWPSCSMGAWCHAAEAKSIFTGPDQYRTGTGPVWFCMGVVLF